jgi:hypothetical protein
VKLRTKDNDFTEQLVNCDGSKASIVAARVCLVPMVTLRTLPFNLEYLDPVVVKITAHNQRGWSEAYPLNDELTGAPYIQTEPLVILAPTEGFATSRSMIEILWTAVVPPNDGGSPVLSYNLYWDRGVGTWINLVG